MRTGTEWKQDLLEADPELRAQAARDLADLVVGQFSRINRNGHDEVFNNLTVEEVDGLVYAFSELWKELDSSPGPSDTKRLEELDGLMQLVFNNFTLSLPDGKYGPPLNGRDDIRRGWQYDISQRAGGSERLELLDRLHAQLEISVDLDQVVKLQSLVGRRDQLYAKSQLLVTVWPAVKPMVADDMKVLRQLAT